MKNRMRTYLTRLTSVLADDMLSFLSVGPHDPVGEREERTYPNSLQMELLSMALESEDVLDLPVYLGNLTSACVGQGMPLVVVAERLRVFRDSVLAHMNRDLKELLLTADDRVEFYQIQLRLYQMVDQVAFSLLSIGQADSSRRQEMESDRELSSQEELLSEVAEQELVQLVLQSNDIAVLMIDRHMNIIEANYALARLFQVDRDEIMGKNIDKTFCPHESERFVQWVIERGQTGHYVAEYNSQWTTVSTSPIYHEGELWGAIAVLRNLTDNKKYEEELTKREALAAVGQLAAGMAHEIRNPLTSIKGFIQLLREQGETNRSESYFSVILTEIERIDGLLNDVLVLARYRDDKIVSECFLVMEEINGVIRLLEPEANRRGIKLELQIATGEWYIYGYRPRIKQAFLNILKNALEALVNQGSMVCVTVFASIHQVVITVEDDGVGLSEVAKQNLFVPFYTTKQEGTGLGLSTTQRIINDHGGEIFADRSPKLGGARFEIRLPLTPKVQA